MKLFIMCLSIMVLLTSCSTQSVKEAMKNGEIITVIEKKLILHLSKPEGQSYTVYKKIEDRKTVEAVMNVLQNVSWEKANASMSRQPDYKIKLINTDPAASFETVTYDAWLTPSKDRLEIIIEEQSKYQKFTKKDSATLLKIIEVP